MLKRKIILVLSVITVLLSALAVVLAAPLFSNAKVIFKGITLVSNGTSTQGFVDIIVKNINTTGVSFCLSYDPDYLELSDVTDNSKISNPATGEKYDLQHKFFEQNQTLFPDDLSSNRTIFWDIPQSFMVTGALSPIIGIADPDNAKVIMNFLPTEDAIALSDYVDQIIINDQPYPAIMADGESDGLRLGRISFNIVDPVGLSRLSQDELKDVLKIVPFSQMDNYFQSTDVDNDEGIEMSYIDDDYKIEFHSREMYNVECDFEIEAQLQDVKPKIDEITVSSYDIFNDGTSQDLLDYLNKNMSMIELTYADGSTVPGIFQWNAADSNFNSISWDPLGGDYTITQPYSSDTSIPDISVTVHVTPITFIGFDFINSDISYFYDPSNTVGFPTNRDELTLPKTVTPVFDTYIPNGGIAAIDITDYLSDGLSLGPSDLPSGFSSGADAVYDIIGLTKYSTVTDMEDDYPWLTINSIPDIDIVRNVVTDTNYIPKTLDVLTDTVDTNGALTLIVANHDGSAIPSGTEFHIKMPGGELIDTSILGSRYSVSYNEDGTVTIIIEPYIENANEKKLAQLLNLGNRGGIFSIASTEPGKNKGPETQFSPDPRRNTYLESNYTFDYSDTLAGMFPVKDSVGYNLPTTITLPMQSDRILTLYSGYDGDEPGSLETFIVDEWLFSGDPTVAGSVVEVTGVLSTLTGQAYTNYGIVYNDANVTVTLKYIVSEDLGTEEIDNISDFIYNKRQVGYDYDRLQTKTFTINNIGATDIYGLSVVIEPSSEASTDGQEAFVLTQTPASLLNTAGSSLPNSTTFDITTKIGLSIGTYVSKVVIMSNDKVLDTFSISFNVTEIPTHDITLTVNEYTWGTASIGTMSTLSESPFYVVISAEEGELINLTATPKIIPPATDSEYAFVEWELISGDANIANTTSEATTFEMPDGDVEIKAVFKETLKAKMRITELRVRNAEDPDPDIDTTKDLQLNDSNWTAVNFDSMTREYYIAVPNNLNTVKIWFKLRDEAVYATRSMTHSHVAPPVPTPSPQPDSLSVPMLDSVDNYYKSQEIYLDECPTENIVTINISWDDPTDDPDEGYVTGSYVLHIYRKLTTSDLFDFEYGNSPVGLIMRDSSILDADKTTEITNFINNDYQFLSSGTVPADATADIKYRAKAWGAVNYDLNENALFVTDNETINDPGYLSARNSIGESLTSSDISRSVKVNVLSETIASLQNGSSTDFVHITPSTFSLSSTGQITELAGLRIRPDIYNLSYSFTDFDGKTVTIDKPLIILTSLGDVNIDHTSDAADVQRIKERYKSDLDLADNYNVTTSTDDYSDGGLLFKYRVCDVNKDGNVNLIDADYIRAGKLSSFYKDLP